MEFRKTILICIYIALSHSLLAQSDTFIKLADRNSIHVVYEILANDEPLILLQAGARSHSGTWSALMPLLREKGYSYLTYDRPGLGQSDSVSGQRDALSIATELHEILKRLNVDKDVLLVGHSMGGVYQAGFNHLFPKRVKGLVMIDSPNSQWEERLRSCLTDEQNIERDEGLIEMRSALPITVQAEYKGAEASFDLLDKLKINIQLVVISGGSQSWPDAYDENCLSANWKKGQEELLALSSNSNQLISSISGHGIPQNDPQIIIQAIALLN